MRSVQNTRSVYSWPQPDFVTTILAGWPLRLNTMSNFCSSDAQPAEASPRPANAEVAVEKHQTSRAMVLELAQSSVLCIIKVDR